MKTLALKTALIAAACASPAVAADLSVKAPRLPPPAPIFSWAGAYGGVNVGAIVADGSADPACINPLGASLGLGCATAPSFSLGSTSIAGGGQVGYNLQYNNVVLGLETDLQASGAAKSASTTGSFPQVGGTFTSVGTITANNQINYFGTVRARIGLAYDRTLFYATGGLIYADVDSSFQRLFPAVAFSGTDDEVRTGFVVGGGLEYAFANHWSGKVEGLYYDLGRNTLLSNALPIPNGFQTGFQFRNTGEIARVGLNYKL
jgi:outer membrane immunogenic protein